VAGYGAFDTGEPVDVGNRPVGDGDVRDDVGDLVPAGRDLSKRTSEVGDERHPLRIAGWGS